MLKNILKILLLCLTFLRVQTICLSSRTGEISKCLACAAGYYSEAFLLTAGSAGNFESNTCQKQSDSTFPEERSFYVTDSNFQDELQSDGSIARPFKNFFEALIAAQRYAQALRSSNLTIFLVKSSEKAGPQEYFWSPAGSQEIYHFFRRVNANITIKPLFCSEQDVRGCFLTENPRPVLYLRSEKQFIFVTNVLRLENVILDGSDISFENLCPSTHENYYKKLFCDETSLFKTFKSPIDSINETSSNCYLMNKESNPNPKSFALFNIEPIFDCPACLKQPSMVIIKNCEFRYMHSFSQNSSSLSALISAQRLKFSVFLINSTVIKSNLPGGVFVSTGEWTPELFLGAKSLYIQVVGDQLTDRDQNVFSFSNSSIAYYDYFNIKYPSPTRGIFLMRSLAFQLIVNGSFFFKNLLLPDKIESVFFISIPSNEQDIFFKLRVQNNTIANNSILSFLNFQRINSNYNGNRYLAIINENKFLNNIDCGFATSMMDINITSSLIQGVNFFNSSFMILNVGRVFVRDVMFSVIKIASSNDLALFTFIGISPNSEINLFSTSPSLNASRESVKIENSIFTDIAARIEYSLNTLNYLQIYNSSFKTVGKSDINIFTGNVEDDFSLINSVFEDVICSYLINMKYSRNHTIRNASFKGILCTTTMIDTNTYAEALPCPTHDIQKLVVKDSVFGDSMYYVHFTFTKSKKIYKFNDCLFENISITLDDNTFFGYILYVGLPETITISNCQFISNKGDLLILIRIQGSSAPAVVADVSLMNSVIIQTSGKPIQNFLTAFYFKVMLVRNCKFIGEGENAGMTMMEFKVPLEYPKGKLSLEKSVFKGLRGKRGGALLLRLWMLDDFLLNSCQFIENKGGEFAADLILNYYSPNLVFRDLTLKDNFKIIKFGIINNSFISSKGGQGGSIILTDRSQGFFLNNTFIDSSAEYGGVICLKENSETIFLSNKVLNSSATYEGGVIWALNCKILITESSFQTSKAKSGGVIYAQNVTTVIFYTDFRQASADLGGALFYSESIIKLRSVDIEETTASLQGGAMTFIKGAITLEILKISNGYCRDLGGAIYFDSAEYLFAMNITLSFIRVSSDGVLTLFGTALTRIIFENILCFQTSSQGRGDCLFITDTEILLINFNLLSVNSTNCGIFVTGINRQTSFTLENSVISNSTLFGSLFQAINSRIFLRSISLTETNSINSQMAFLFDKCSVNIKFFSFDGLLKEKSSGRLFRAENSNVSLEAVNLKLSRILGAAMFLACEAVLITNSEFIQAKSNLDKRGGVILIINSMLSISKSSIVIAEAPLGAAIYSENSNLIISDVTNFQSAAYEFGAFLYSIKTNTESNCFIVLNNVKSLGSWGNDISVFNYDKFSVKNYTFYKSSKKNSNETLKEALRLGNINLIKLENLIIESFLGLYPLFIFTEKGRKSQLVANGIIIKKSFSYKSGAGIHFQGSLSGNISNSSFLELETNDSGGAFFFSCPAKDCSLLIENCRFKDLTARKYGGFLNFQDPGLILGEKNEFENISAGLGNTTVGQPSRAAILVNNDSDLFGSIKRLKSSSFEFPTEINDVVSGQPLNLISFVLDENNKTMIYENSGKITIISKENNTFIENEFAYINQGIAIFNNFKISALPGNQSTVILEYTNPVNSKTFSSSLRLNLRKCIRGEILSGMTCQRCPRGFYSIDDDPLSNKIEMCLACPPNAECPGGHQVFPAQGFWRKDENQSRMAKCLADEGCPGGGLMNGFNFFPICEVGYKGKLCMKCEKNFGYDSHKKCIKCSDNPSHYIKFVLVSLISLLIIVYQTQKAFEINISSSKLRALIKILVDHFSYVSFISTFQIEWSSIALNMISVGDQYVTTVPKEMFNFDCFFTVAGLEEQKILINFITISLTPIAYGVLCLVLLILFLLLKNKLEISSGNKEKSKPSHEIRNSTERKKIIDSEPEPNQINEIKISVTKSEIKSEVDKSQASNQNKDFLLVSQVTAMLIIIFYNFYPRIMLNAIELLECIGIDDSDKTYMVWNVETECWAAEHTKIVLILTFSNIIVWGIGTPILLFLLTRLLVQVEKKTKNSNLKKLIDFITLDYKNKYYYWDIMSYFTKLLIVALKVATHSLDTYSQGSLITLFFIVLFLIQEKFKPYHYDFVNELKTLSYITTICSAAFAIMASNKKAENNQKVACVFISIFSTFVFYFAWAYSYFKVIKANRAETLRLKKMQLGQKKNSKITGKCKGLFLKSKK